MDVFGVQPPSNTKLLNAHHNFFYFAQDFQSHFNILHKCKMLLIPSTICNSVDYQEMNRSYFAFYFEPLLPSLPPSLPPIIKVLELNPFSELCQSGQAKTAGILLYSTDIIIIIHKLCFTADDPSSATVFK